MCVVRDQRKAQPEKQPSVISIHIVFWDSVFHCPVANRVVTSEPEDLFDLTFPALGL